MTGGHLTPTRASVTPKEMHLAVRLSSNLDAKILLDCAQMAERIGLDRCWFANNPYERPALITVAAVSQAVSKIDLGVGVVNVRVHHPMILAQDAIGVAALCRGRFALGLGTSALWHRATLGLPKVGGLGLMETTVRHLRTLFGGKAINFGDVDATPAGLGFASVSVPILIGSVGPRSLDLTGRIADGVIFSNGCTLAYLQRAVEITRAAAIAAGRDALPFDRVAYVLYGGPVERQEANARLKQPVGYFISHMAAMFKGTEMGDEAEVMARALADGASVDSVVTDEMVDAASLWGPPERCLKQLRVYKKLGVTEVAFSIGDWLPDPVAAIVNMEPIVQLWKQESIEA